MIGRILILLLAVLLLPQLYIDLRKLRRRSMLMRMLRWVPTLAMMGWTLWLALERDFVAEDMTAVNIYLLVFGLVFLPKLLYVLCSVTGRAIKLLCHARYNWGNLIGILLAVFCVYVVLYGSFYGVRRLNVNRMEIEVEGLPEAFDGYRIVLFSDAHVGSFTGWRRQLLQRDIDSINAQQADVILFAGDLQNLRPSELYPVQDMLRQLQAPDGIYSVLGNHDYSDYIEADPAVKTANERELQSRMRQMGWTLLRNEAAPILREWKGSERRMKRKGKGKEIQNRLVIAGMENEGMKEETRHGNLAKTLKDVGPNDCVILLQHDPTAWRRVILPESNVALTLSGHTHGGQLSLFGWRISKTTYDEDYGLYHEGGRQLYVTCGIGGLLPFRFGITPEIAVITLIAP